MTPPVPKCAAAKQPVAMARLRLACFRGPVTDRLEFSFRMLTRICTPETLALAFAGVLFIETLPLVIRPIGDRARDGAPAV